MMSPHTVPAPMPNPAHLHYLRRRGRVYWLKLPIPRKLQHLYLSCAGKPRSHIEENLNERTALEANRAKRRRVMHWDAIFSGQTTELLGTRQVDADEAAQYRAALLEAANDDEAHDLLTSLACGPGA